MVVYMRVQNPELLGGEGDLFAGEDWLELSAWGGTLMITAYLRGGPRISDRLLRWDPDQREGVWNVPKETELSG